MTYKKRSEVLHGETYKVKTGCGNLYVTLNSDGEGKLFEIFARMGKAGGCAAAQNESLGRLASLGLRSGVDPKDIIKQLKGVSCHQPVFTQNGRILSCADAMATAIEWHLEGRKKEREEHEEKNINGQCDKSIE